MLHVFDIQRYALHDGPGIRTTVFVKGCPLDCLWCHNPESKRREPQLGCLFSQCVSCGACRDVCPQGAHQVESGAHTILFDRCKACGECVAACGTGALRLYGRGWSTGELMEVIGRDAAYYGRSGGGLTISGGEPLLQFDGTLELLRAAREQGIHTCLDTCGFAPQERYEVLLPYVDLFLLDYKLTQPERHKRYTGVSNELILSNLAFLCSHGAHVFLRCPIIPGVNDDDGHLEAVAALSRAWPEAIEQVNIMAYHNMASGKTAQLGGEYALRDLPSMTREDKAHICRRLEALGCIHLRES